jgi:hypothetical protein
MLSNESCRANFDAGTLLLRSETHDLTCIRNSAPATEVCEPLHLCLQEPICSWYRAWPAPSERGTCIPNLHNHVQAIWCQTYFRLSHCNSSWVAYNVSVRPIGLVNVRISYPNRKADQHRFHGKSTAFWAPVTGETCETWLHGRHQDQRPLLGAVRLGRLEVLPSLEPKLIYDLVHYG